MVNEKRLIERFSLGAPVLEGRPWEEGRAEIQQWSENVVSILDGLATSGALDDHNDLNGLQGGTTTERYHFTLAQHAYLSVHQGSADPHGQYFLLAGRSGGQIGFGSPTSGEDLTLAGNPGANPGFINLNSPVIFGPYTGNPAATYGFSYTATDNPPGAFIGGGLNFSGNITTANAVFIYESFRGAPVITTGVAPGFAAYTVLQALPQLAAGAAAGLNPLNPLILNAGPQVHNPFTGTKTAANAGAVNWAPTIRASAAGATMNVTNVTGFINAPKFSTVAGSAISFGTIRGLWCQNPAVALFNPGAGTETMTAYYGLDFANITFGGTAPRAAVRSALASGTNRYFLLNTSTALSDFGGSKLRFNDDPAGVVFGNSDDLELNWAGIRFRMQPASGQTLQWEFQTNAIKARSLLFGFDTVQMKFAFHKFAFGQESDVGNQIGVFVAPTRATEVNGGWADFLLTQAGNLTIDHTMSDVAAWVINPISLTAGAGSITGYVSCLSVGMTTSGLGAAETHGIRLTGRETIRGVHAFEALSPAALTADVNNYAPATGNSMRQVWRVTTNGSGPYNITGVAVQQGSDTQFIVNVHASDAIILQHQNASSTATNRMISPTGADLTLGPNEYAFLWHDSVTDRWRILDTNGA